MDLFKIEESGKSVYIKILSYNERIWTEMQWSYRYVRLNSYPTEQKAHATDFKTIEAAQEWIKEHSPA